MQEPPKSVLLSDEANNKEQEIVQDRAEVSSLFHIKERDFSSLRDRHRRLRQRIRDRDKAEATTTTTTRRPVTRFVSVRLFELQNLSVVSDCRHRAFI